MRALVTGSSGFLGRHLVRALSEVYDAVDGIDLVAPEEPPSGESYVADLRSVLPDLGGYDAAFHLAADVGGRARLDAEPLGVAANLALDVAFLSWVARTRPRHAAYVSSSAVYAGSGRYAETDVCLDAPVLGRPDGTYGWVKLTGEQVARLVPDVHVVCYRPFTVYGPHQRATYPVPAIVSRALRREDPMTVWGSGRQVRDLVHVSDAVAAIVATHRKGPPALNVCTGVGTSFVALAETAARLAGYDAEVRGDPSKPAGVDCRVGDPALLHRWYAPKVSVEDGVATVMEWLAG